MSAEFKCPECRRTLYVSGEVEMACPYCGVRVVVPSEMSECAEAAEHAETIDERCDRLEREKEIAQHKAEIESHASFDNFWNVGGGWFSAIYRQSARNALDSGDLEKARRSLATAKKLGNVGCLIQILLFFVIVVVLGSKI